MRRDSPATLSRQLARGATWLGIALLLVLLVWRLFAPAPRLVNEYLSPDGGFELRVFERGSAAWQTPGHRVLLDLRARNDDASQAAAPRARNDEAFLTPLLPAENIRPDVRWESLGTVRVRIEHLTFRGRIVDDVQTWEEVVSETPGRPAPDRTAPDTAAPPTTPASAPIPTPDP